MKLFYAAASPYVRKCMIVAHELGLADRLELVQGRSSPLDPNPDVVAVNPVGKIPALITDDAGTVVDSRVICRYLNETGGGSFYGTGTEGFRIKAREAMAEGMIDALLLAVYETRLKGDKASQEWIDGQRGKAFRGIGHFEKNVDELGGDFTIDQVALGAALGYADFRHPDMAWRDRAPKLAAWFEALSAKPSMQATVPSD
ncbi:MAG: glutathione S-transferase [Pseudomonadota bacterium]